MTLYFGLGGAAKASRVEIRWPSGARQEWKDVAANQPLAATEGAA